MCKVRDFGACGFLNPLLTHYNCIPYYYHYHYRGDNTRVVPIKRSSAVLLHSLYHIKGKGKEYSGTGPVVNNRPYCHGDVVYNTTTHQNDRKYRNHMLQYIWKSVVAIVLYNLVSTE